MGQFLQGGNLGYFMSLFLRVKAAHCGAKTFPYMLLAAVIYNHSNIKLFERGPRFGQCIFDKTTLQLFRPSQLAELSHSQFDQELFSHSAYAKFYVTFATEQRI